LAALRQGDIDLLKQVVGAIAYRYIPQNNFSILCLDSRQAARPIDHGGDRMEKI
jgi:hypothetical protein